MLNPDNTDEHRSKALGIKSRKIGSIGVDRCSALDWAPPMQPISAQVDDYFAWGQTLRPMILLSEIRPEGVFSMKLTSIAILIVTCCLAGCTLPNSTTTGTPTPGSLNGNWQLVVGGFPVGVVFATTNGAVSGLAIMQAPVPQYCRAGVPCGFPEVFLGGNLTGTVDESGNFTLTASSSYPSTFTLTGNVSGSGLTGTFSLTAGTSTDSGTVSGTYIQPIDGTYIGVATSAITGASLSVTAILTQGSTPGSNGALPLSGTVAFGGYNCFSSTTVSTGSAVLGEAYGLTLVPTNTSSSVGAEGGVSPDAKTLTFDYAVFGGGCAFDDGTGTLTRQ
jgi:hypothetical protein